MNNPFMDRLRSFLGLRNEPPRNEFRNPIWGSDDDDDDDELYNRNHATVFNDPMDMHRQFIEQMHKMFDVFGSMFGDMKTFFPENDNLDSFAHITEIPTSESESFTGDTESIRDYYLKPGYHNPKLEQPQEDVDLDGKISSNEISGFLNPKDEKYKSMTPFSSNLFRPGKSFCQTIITTSVTKPDGTIETRRIVKNGNEVIEETTTSTGTDPQSPFRPGFDSISNHSVIFDNLTDFLAYFKNFN